MAKELEMTDISLMSYYLGIEIKQKDEGIFVSQENYAKEILRIQMDKCKPVNTPINYGNKISKHDKREKVDHSLFKSIVESLRYFTCIRPDILFGVGLVNRYMESPTTIHLKAAKSIIRYIKGTGIMDYSIHPVTT